MAPNMGILGVEVGFWGFAELLANLLNCVRKFGGL